MSEGWIGVDLDGTLAEYLGWQGMGHIGEPIAPMAERVRAWLAVGKDVRIFTARVCSIQSQEDIDIFLREYTRWCFRVFGRQLPVTCEKDWKMIELWDDRCVQIMPNTGIMVQDALVREVQSMKNDDMKRRARIAELEAERNQLREALKEIVMLSTVDQVCNNCRHCQKLRYMDWCAWYCNAIDDSSTQVCKRFELADMHNSDVHTIARKVLKGAGE